MQRTATLRHQRGATLVEYALVVPIFLLLVVGILEFGRIIFTYNTLANVAREGARYGITHPRDTEEVEREIAARALATGLDGTLTISITWPSNAVRVEVTYQVDLMTGPFIDAISEVVGGVPLIIPTLRAVSTMQLE